MRHPHDHRPVRTGLLSAAFVAAGTLGLAAPTQAVTKYRVIALTGEAAPGANADLDNVHGPRINLGGQVAFFTTLENGDIALYRTVYDDPSTLELIVLTGDDVPGAPFGDMIGSGVDFPTVQFNDDGDLAFQMPIDNLNEPNPQGVFRFVNGQLETVALSGQQVPGAPNGVEYDDFGGVSMNASGSLAFPADLQGNVNAGNDDAIFAHAIGGLQLIARKGSPAFGRPQDTYGSLYGGMLADNGRVQFWSPLNGDYDQGSVWTGWPGFLTPLSVAGEGAPNVDGYLGYSMSAVGASFMSYGPQAIVRDLGEGLETVAQYGAAGPLGTYDAINQFHLSSNASGAVFFGARFAEPADDVDSALIHVRSNGQEEVIAREGDVAPAYWNGVEFDSLWNSNDSDVDFDDAGRLYYSVSLRGAGIQANNDRALYGRNLDGTVDALIKEGQLLEVRDNDHRIVEEYRMARGYGSQSGRRGATNDVGDIVLEVRFVGGSEAVIVVQQGTFCAGDFNHDGKVDVDDLVILFINWDQTTAIGEDGDTDRNGHVDVSDLVELIVNWGFCV